MPLHHAVLALLTDGPSHGYELKTRFQQTIGPQWGELHIGHLYQVLDRLARDGLVSGEVEVQDRRPDRTVYRLTEAGRTELAAWLDEAAPRSSGYRDDFFLKVMAAARGEAGTVREVARQQRRSLLAELRGLGSLQKEHASDPLILLLIEAATLHTRADLDLVDLVESRARVLASQAKKSADQGRRQRKPGVGRQSA